MTTASWALLGVTLVVVAALVAVAYTLVGVVRSHVREHARERNLLINQILHLSGRTWQPPPVRDTSEDDAEIARVMKEMELLAFTDPGQLPDDYLQ